MKKGGCPLVLAIMACFLVGCAGENGFRVENLAKSDIDMVAEAHVRETRELLEDLTGKLYRRNPSQLHRAPGQTLESRMEQLFGSERTESHEELEGRRSIEAMLLAFDDDFQGDRVFAMMLGLATMMAHSYENKDRFFMLDKLDEQKLYNSARNIEILSWRLRSRSRADGELFLLSNSFGKQPNLSFERVFSKLIAHQDMMAILVSQKNNRAINKVVQGVATTMFLPI
ncbi:MAG: hypothetical protein ACR2PT_10840 [Endozoicomonas sp.]